MPDFRTTAAAVGLALSVLPATLSAQIDYRNLDEGRPVLTEDAYPVERYAFEVLAPYRFERDRGGARTHLFLPELEYGPLPNTQIGVGISIVGEDERPGSGTDWGLAGLEVSGLYNFNTESRWLPAIAVRGDVALPVGSLAGNDTRFTLKTIATRSWGATRVHLNLASGLGHEGSPGAVESAPRWRYTLGADRTLFRRSTLLVGEVTVTRAVKGAPTEVNAGLGARYQWSPTLVLDLGVSRRLKATVGPDYGLTFGLSHAFAIRGLMPSGSR